MGHGHQKLRRSDPDVDRFDVFVDDQVIGKPGRFQTTRVAIQRLDVVATGTEGDAFTGPAGQGTLMTFSPDPRKNPIAAGLVKRFRAMNYEPEGYTLYTYGAIQAWAMAAEKAGSTDTGKLIKVLRTSKFETVLGRIGFDAKGDVTAPGYVFYEWSEGKYDYYR